MRGSRWPRGYRKLTECFVVSVYIGFQARRAEVGGTRYVSRKACHAEVGGIRYFSRQARHVESILSISYPEKGLPFMVVP